MGWGLVLLDVSLGEMGRSFETVDWMRDGGEWMRVVRLGQVCFWSAVVVFEYMN